MCGGVWGRGSTPLPLHPLVSNTDKNPPFVQLPIEFPDFLKNKEQKRGEETKQQLIIFIFHKFFRINYMSACNWIVMHFLLLAKRE